MRVTVSDRTYEWTGVGWFCLSADAPHDALVDDLLTRIKELEEFQQLHMMPGMCSCDFCMAQLDAEREAKNE